MESLVKRLSFEKGVRGFCPRVTAIIDLMLWKDQMDANSRWSQNKCGSRADNIEFLGKEV
jgi:hypothetical protein